ncbi:MAG: cyclase family protein [Patescibacteria group bacterium]|nr:cyclase family protein [Patescibacteria group bacterium]
MAFRIIDISLPLDKTTVVYPGNPAIRITPRRGKTSDMSAITLGSHTGTHIDAPRHVFKKGRGVGELALDRCVGPCRVLDLTGVRTAVTTNDLRSHRIRSGERILVKTRNSKRGFKKWYDDYIWLAPDAAVFLARKKIALFGIDSWSVKQRGSPDNRPHTALLARGIPILEGLNLKAVRPGRYFLAALPLRFSRLDGAPARAVLFG